MSDRDLRSHIIRIASELPKGNATRRELLALLKEALVRPSPELVALFDKFNSERLLIIPASYRRTDDFVTKFVATLPDIILDDMYLVVEDDHDEEVWGTGIHPDYGPVDYYGTYTNNLDISSHGDAEPDVLTFKDFVIKAAARVNARVPQPTKVALQLASSKPFLAYLRHSFPEAVLKVESQLPRLALPNVRQHAYEDETEWGERPRWNTWNTKYRVNMEVVGWTDAPWVLDPSASYVEFKIVPRGIQWTISAEASRGKPTDIVIGGGEPKPEPKEPWTPLHREPVFHGRFVHNEG